MARRCWIVASPSPAWCGCRGSGGGSWARGQSAPRCSPPSPWCSWSRFLQKIEISGNSLRPAVRILPLYPQPTRTNHHCIGNLPHFSKKNTTKDGKKVFMLFFTVFAAPSFKRFNVIKRDPLAPAFLYSLLHSSAKTIAWVCLNSKHNTTHPREAAISSHRNFN